MGQMPKQMVIFHLNLCRKRFPTQFLQNRKYSTKNNTPPLSSDVEREIHKMRNGKSAGIDELPAEE